MKIIVPLTLLVLTALSCSNPDRMAGSNLEKAFINPGQEAKPWVYWYWMNGNVTKEGITADIEAMNRVGIGGAYLMCIGGPWDRPGLEKAYNQLTPEWWELVDHAFAEAGRFGMELGMSACDGWATAGGPFITPGHGMKKVVWSISPLEGGANGEHPSIPMPPLHEGTYQDAGDELSGERRFYRDIACFAFPARESIHHNMTAYRFQVQTDIPDIQADKLFDGNTRETAVNTPYNGFVQIGFDAPFTCRSVRFFIQANRWFPYPYYAASMELQTSDDGTTFSGLYRLVPDQHGWQDDGTPVTFRIPEVTARYFRFIFNSDTVIPITMRYVGSERKYLSLSEIELSPFAWIDHFEAKAACRYRVAPPTTPGLTGGDNIPLGDMINVSAFLDSAGVLSWKAPAGRWTILRMGYTLTGNENETGGGGIGLESDKLSKEATSVVFNGWLGETLRKTGKERAGQPLALMHVDSWEAASQNWTDDFVREFERKRGYNPVPYLPALAGIPVESTEVYENFLYDFRNTLTDLLNENFYGELARLSHENGSLFSAEATAPVMPSDGMLHYKYVDRPMGEFWRDDPAPYDKPEDILEAVSGAHVYNRNIVQAEAFTDVDSKWYEHPWLFKKQGDYNFCRGINKFFIHVYTQQPFVDRHPGFTLGQTGLHFNRGQVWWNESKPWINYLTVCQSVLQQGHQVADILCFTGMEIPRRGLLPDQLNVSIPEGYRYISINPDGLLNQVILKDGMMRLPGGAMHKVLVLSNDPYLGGGKYTPEVLRKLENLVKGGIILVGPRPAGIYGLQDLETGKQVFSEVTGKLWGPVNGRDITVNRHGKGSVYWGEPLAEILKKESISPDLTVNGTDSIDFIHKQVGSTDVYFISSQSGSPLNAELSFRTEGRTPEIWDPAAGSRHLCRHEIAGGRTLVRLHLNPYESRFIVFNREASPGLTLLPEYLPLEQTSLKGTWQISFEPHRGVPASFFIHTDTLFSLPRHPDPDVRHFSGKARYELTFEFNLPDEGGQVRHLLTLGRVCDIARVTLNGQELGILWTQPMETDVTGALVNGTNTLVVEVTNTWNNRIVRDMTLPLAERVSYFPHYEEFRNANDRNGFLMRSVDYNLRDAGLIGPCKILSLKETTNPSTMGQLSTLPGDADHPTPNWWNRHEEKVAAIRTGDYDLFLIGNSITQNLCEWDGEWADQQQVWERFFAPRNAINLGYSGYRTENILWNLMTGELDQKRSPMVAMLLIGTNNLDDQHYPVIHTAEEVFRGTRAIVNLIRERHPNTKILILRIFPAGGPNDKTPYSRKYNRSASAYAALQKAGEMTRQLADDEHIFWLDVNPVFLNPDGTIKPELMPDLIHPNGAGTEAWVRAVEPTLSRLLGEKHLN